MSDLPRTNPDKNSDRLRISAMVLSFVVGSFVSYWAAALFHIVLENFFPQLANAPLTWALTILTSILVGIGSGVWACKALTGCLEQ